MTEIQKRNLIGMLIFVCLLMVLLGIGLPRLQMQSGVIFSAPESEGTSFGTSPGFGDVSWLMVLIQGAQILLIILLPIYIVISLLSKRGRRKLLMDILKILVLFLIVMWMSEMGGQSPMAGEQIGIQIGAMDFTALFEGADPFPEFEANPQPWMLPLIILGAAALVAAITYFGLRLIAKRRAADGAPLREFANKAQAALDDIEGGKIDFDDVIIRCYAEMSQILLAEKGIQRAQSMTTQEFGQELLAKGFPPLPVQRLTQLFEQVRYGGQQPGESAKMIATESLREIIYFCRGQA
jgi:hypothetical protein